MDDKKKVEKRNKIKFIDGQMDKLSCRVGIQ